MDAGYIPVLEAFGAEEMEFPIPGIGKEKGKELFKDPLENSAVETRTEARFGARQAPLPRSSENLACLHAKTD